MNDIYDAAFKEAYDKTVNSLPCLNFARDPKDKNRFYVCCEFTGGCLEEAPSIDDGWLLCYFNEVPYVLCPHCLRKNLNFSIFNVKHCRKAIK